MSIVSVSEQFQPDRYLLVSLRTEEDTITTTNIIVSNPITNSINLVTIEKGPQGERGPIGPQGPAGKDAITFSILPINSGGTNNTIFNSGYLISYDGNKLASSDYTIQDIVDLASTNSNAITGIIPGTGLQKIQVGNNTAILDVKVGEGLTVTNNLITVDNTIARTAELSLGAISGMVPISKGGTNNDIFNLNQLIYYNGTKLTSLPLNTGTIVVSGSAITVEAGSGLIGGGNITIPSGSVLLQIGGSSDILVEENSISLSSTGTAGTYTKILTDAKGRVISGSWLTTSDVLAILGYTPWHPGNDGSGSGLDADLLDGQHGTFYRDASNLTGTLPTERLTDIHASGDQYGTKFRINAKGLVDGIYYASYTDIIDSLGFRPLNASSNDQMDGFLTVAGGLAVSGGETSLYDNLPLFGLNSPNILPSEPRGFTFKYGATVASKTGILAYYPTENQLRLITNIYGSGALNDVDGNGNSFDDDLNGGSASTIYITQNLEGDKLTVLFREIADQLYINTNQEQTINALKKFLQGIDVVGQIRFLSNGSPPSSPPFDLAGNSLKVIGLNSDLLDSQDGAYYRNAANITGNFSYNNVSFDHIAGTNNYIPKFNDTGNPARKIDSSNIKQRTDGDIEITNDVNLSIGEDNTISSASLSNLVGGTLNVIDSENSIAIGDRNKVYSTESAAIGSYNIASGDNSIAMNYGSITKGKNSIAVGSYGLTTLENQMAFGAFRTTTGNTILEHGQYSTIAAYLKGTETNGAWSSLSPIIQLPKEKTIAYNIELLMNKGLSSGVAYFTFTSGIINNATYRDPNNISNIINSTTTPGTGYKIESYNNSQLRRHTHKWTYNDLSYPQLLPNSPTTKTQYVWSKSPQAQNLGVDLRYVYPYYFYTPENVVISGVFEKNHDGSLVLDIHRPRYYESFTQHSTNNTIIIQTQKDHNAVQGSLLECNFSSGSLYLPPSGRYTVAGVINSNNVAVSAPKWSAVKYSLPSGAKIVINAPSGFDEYFNINISGSLQTTSITYSSTNFLNEYGYLLHSYIKPNMTINIQYTDYLNNVYNYRRIITGISQGTIQINAPLKTINTIPTIIGGPILFSIDDFSAHLFKSCNKIWIDGEAINISGAQTKTTPIFKPSSINFVNDGGAGDINNPAPATLIGYQNSGFIYENDSYGNPSFSIITATRIDRLLDGQTIDVAPLFNNNIGAVDIYARKNLSCTYSSSLSNLNVHTGVYVRYIDGPGNQRIRIYDTNNKPLDFVSGPMKYELADGPFSELNYKFKIIQEKNRYFLYTNDQLDYEENNIVPVRIKCTPSDTNYANPREQVLNIYVKNLNESPRINVLLPTTGIVADNLFYYSLPTNMFIEPDNDTLEYTANVKGGHPLPRWLYFDANNLYLSGIPDQCDVGIYSIDIKASDSSGLYAFNNLIVEVSGNNINQSNVLASGINETLKINNIILSNNVVIENTKDVLIGELTVDGGYNPYVFFGSASNRVSGVFSKNSDLFRYAEPEIKKFTNIVTISGAPQLFGLGTTVSAQKLPISHDNLLLPNNTKVLNTYRPTVLSGTPISGNLFIFDNIYVSYKNFAIFTGQYLGETNISECFAPNLRAKNIDDYNIIFGQALIKENKGLILTEDNHALDHGFTPPNISFKIEKENNNFDLQIENTQDFLLHSDNRQKAVAWSKKLSYSKLFDEQLEYSLQDTNDTLITDNLSNYEFITHPATFMDISLVTENNSDIITETKDKIIGIDLDSRVWFTTEPFRIRHNLRENISLELASTIPNNPLVSINVPIDYDNEGLYTSNIDYSRLDLMNPYDSWTFIEKINNPVLYLNGIGSNDITQLITEDRNYSGYFYNTSPFEYAILSTEDNFGLLPESEKLNGSRIEFSNRYELIESTKIYPDNGTLSLEGLLDELICENHDQLVYDYAILAHSGSAYILFPGIVSQLVIKYPTTHSYSPEKVQNGSLGYYEDNPSIMPSSLRFSEPDFYYTWGKLIPYYAYTDEYAIRLNHIYDHDTTSGLLVYTGVAPDNDNYFPEESLFNSVGINSGDCPINIPNSIINGIVVKDNLVSAHYTTGTATFYTSFAANDIIVSSSEQFNKDLRINDYIYLYEPSSNQTNALFPKTDTYTNILSATPNSIKVQNLFLYPSEKIVAHTGNIKLNLDRNHEQVTKSSDYVNRLPIIFNNVYNVNLNRIPKNYLFNINAISGQKIYTLDNTRYLLNSDNYLDSIISGTYITNGFEFFGSLFHDNAIIYDIRKTNKSIVSEYTNITFEYNKDLQKLSLNLPTGIVSVFDNIRLSNFQPLLSSMLWDHNATYNTGFKIFKENMSIRSIDDVPDKDFVLLERSAAVLQPENSERLTFTTNIFNHSASGTCKLNINLINRLEPGYIINYANNTSKITGHQYIDYDDGYAFSGIVPRYHSILSTTGTLNDSRIGYASIFNSGNDQWINGIRSVRRAQPNDIGYTDFYNISSTGFIGHTNNIPYLNLKGVGSPDRWYITDYISTSGTNKSLQFLYLGHNTNSIRVFGGLQAMPGSTGNLIITKITPLEQESLEQLESLGINSGISPVFTTGINSTSGFFDISIPVNRLDTITMNLVGSTINNFSYAQLNTYVENIVNTPALILDSNIPIFTGKLHYPRRNLVSNNLFYILPSINTSTKYCNNAQTYNKNNNIFYNVNIIRIENLSSIKSYTILNDQLEIRHLNHSPVASGYAKYIQKINSTNESYIVSGISLDGTLSIPSSTYDYQYANLRENSVRHSLPFGTGYGFLPNTGTISFIPHYSGTFNLINYNNIYLQSYGGYTSRWPQDVDAVISNSPLTGVYTISTDNKNCYANKLCISISPYLNSSFASLNLQDSYFFDFDSIASSISNTYKITDFIDNNKISINTNYDSSLIGGSGLVFIIPSKYNIKTHLYPNINNTFINQSISLSLNTQLVQNTINYFDPDTKKWTHIYHLTKNIPTYSGYAIKFNNDSGNIIYNTTNKIGINGISLYNSTGISFSPIVNNFTIYSDSLGETLKISTTGGSPMLVFPPTVNIPKIYISGLASYRTLTNASPLLYGYRANSGWDIAVEILPMAKTGIYPLTIIARDETGESTMPLTLTIKDRPSVTTTYGTGYFTTSSTEWFLNFDTMGLDLLNDFAGNQGITISGSPNDLSYDIDIRDASTISVQGYRLAGNGGTIPFNTGLWMPVIKFNDFYTGQTIVAGTGMISILDNLNNRPAFIPTLNKNKNHYYVDISQLQSLSFYIPVYEQVNNPSTFFTAAGINSTTSISWDGDTNRYIATVIPKNTGNNSYLSETKYIPNGQFSYNVDQYFYTNGSQSTVNYNSNVYNFALTFYRPLSVNYYYNSNTSGIFSIDQPWTYEFALEEGANKHRPDKPPRVKLYNTPSMGNNDNVDLSYKVRYKYNENGPYWIVLLEGRPDIYGKYASNTGIYNIRFTADDQIVSSITGSFNIRYTYQKSINYIQSNIYTTPNNEFFINADIIDKASGSKGSNQITFAGDNSLYINPSKSALRFDSNFNIWEFYATGNKLVDKWDARLLIDTTSEYPSLTLQCKGIADDKVTAIAKVNLLELQNNNIDILEGLPIKITGVNNGDPNTPWTPQSGLIIKQGEEWKLNFRTVFGLASPQHPPTIILSGTPTVCSGYDPRFDPLYNLDLPPNTQLHKCIIKPTFDDSNKAWNFSFSGDPSCLLSGELDFSIIAIDTNLSNNPIYIEPSDNFVSLFTYIPTEQQHPAPNIIQVGPPEYNINTSIQPGCGSPYLNVFRFGPTNRAVCPIPTGLTGIITSGSLPTGLTFTINYSGPEGNLFNAPYFNNLSSGLLTIEGSVSGHPPSGLSTYNEKFYLTIFDARGKSKTQQVSFSTSVTPMAPNVYFNVYFENTDPVFTPATGTEKLLAFSVPVKQPAASVLETVCYTTIPDSQHCAKFPVMYSGAAGSSTDYLVLYPVSGYTNQYQDINTNVLIYFNILDSNINDSVYRVQKATSLVGLPAHVPLNSFYIRSIQSITSPHTGIAEIVIEKYVNRNLNDLGDIFDIDDITISTEGCILGNGRLATDNQGQYGIYGLLSAGFSGVIPTGGTYLSTDTFGTGLQYTTVDDSSKYAEIKYVTCPETGFVRFSGIALPPIFIEITDPPPLANRSYGDDSTTFSLNSRLAYGNSVIDRNKPQNERAGTAYYTVINLVSDSILQSGTVAVAPQNSAPIRLTASALSSSANNRGAVFRIDYVCSGGIFPTLNSATVPSAVPSTYSWIHKAGFLGDIPTPSSFPPVIISYPNSLNLISGELINYNSLNGQYGILGLALGGYVPTDICIGGTCPPGYTNYPYLLSVSGNNNSVWSSSSYLPKISGIILETINSRQFNNTGIIPDSTNTIGYLSTSVSKLVVQNDWLAQYNQPTSNSNMYELYDINNLIEVTVKYTSPVFPFQTQILDIFTTGLTSGNFDYSGTPIPGIGNMGSRPLVFDKSYIGFSNPTSVNVILKPITKITSIDTGNNYIYIRHNNLSMTIDTINIILDKIVSESQNQYSSIFYAFTDKNTTLSVNSISNTGLILVANGGSTPSGIYSGFSSDQNIKIHSTIEDNIKIMPYNIDSNTEGNFDFLISGRANILYGKYNYRIMTQENSTAPIYTLGWTPKTYYKDCIMNVGKPLSIISSNVSWSQSATSWTVTLVVSGGVYPGLTQPMKVKIDRTGLGNWTYCGFNRYPYATSKDTHNFDTGLTTIILSSSNNLSWGPGTISSFDILVYDDSGSDTITINRQS